MHMNIREEHILPNVNKVEKKESETNNEEQKIQAYIFINSVNLNEQYNELIEKRKIEEYLYIKLNLKNLIFGKGSKKIYHSFNVLFDLLEIDVINRIFKIFNSDNLDF